jgi:hypothetical protein
MMPNVPIAEHASVERTLACLDCIRTDLPLEAGHGFPTAPEPADLVAGIGVGYIR